MTKFGFVFQKLAMLALVLGTIFYIKADDFLTIVPLAFIVVDAVLNGEDSFLSVIMSHIVFGTYDDFLDITNEER